MLIHIIIFSVFIIVPHTPWLVCPAPQAMLQTFGPGPGLPYHCPPRQHGPARRLRTAPSNKQTHTIMLHAVLSLGNEMTQQHSLKHQETP